MPTPAKPLSPTEIAALEHAFSADPSSGAWRSLTEAYLSVGRFMEAMVVCKKGVKARPDDPTARVLMAQVYAAQGKDKKALEELAEALRTHPDDVPANRMAGVLQLKLGEKEAGEAALRKAAELLPDDPETLEALRKWGVTPAPPRPPPAPPPAPERARPAAPAMAPPVLSPAGAGRAAAPAAHPAPAPAAAGTTSTSTSTAAAAVRAATGTRHKAQRNEAYAEHLAEKFQTEEWQLRHRPPPRKTSRAAVIGTLLLATVLLGALGGWWAMSAYRKRRAVEIDRLLKQTRELLEKDAYASYKEAGQLCEKILERDPDSLGGRSYLAYVDAIRWGEHGEPEGFREEAKKQVALAKKLGQTHSHLLAADAYLQYYGGDPKGAAEGLQRFLSGSEGGTSALLHGTLGIIQMQVGDLDAARDSLILAQRYAPGDVRIVQHLAELYRRRGVGFELQAWTLYEVVLQRLSRDHVPSLLGQAQLLLERDQPDAALKQADRVLGKGEGALPRENVSPRQEAVAHALRGGALFALKKEAEGAEEERKAEVLNPTSPDIHDLIGRRKLRSGDFKGAQAAFEKAIQLDPVRVSFVTSLGDALRGAGEVDRAMEQYQRAVDLSPKAVEARIARARIWRERKDWPKALDELERAQKALGSSGTGTGLSQLLAETAEVQEASGAKFELVRDLYLKALKADSASCPALFWLGQKAFEQKKAEDAKPLIGDYLRICPRGPRAAEAQKIASALK
jgi:tetratricopeptide (TPR) repeat protein